MGGLRALGGGGARGDQRAADGALWALYMSFVHVGQVFYGYGWEIQLLETGFLAIFLCPLLDSRPFPRGRRRRRRDLALPLAHRSASCSAPASSSCAAIRAGATSPASTTTTRRSRSRTRCRWLAPLRCRRWFHAAGVLFNHVAELVAPLARSSARAAPRSRRALLLVVFQVILILSGNLSFLNWLTHRAGARLLRRRAAAPRAARAAWRARRARRPRAGAVARAARSRLARCAVLVAVLSIGPVRTCSRPARR